MAATGSSKLDRIVTRLAGSADPKRRYQYVLWLASRLAPLDNHLRCPDNKVPGCVSQVYVKGSLVNGRLHWQGDSDAQITKGLLAMLIEGTEGLEPATLLAMEPGFIQETGLHESLTPSRANGFVNIFRMMQRQAQQLAATG